jgi:L-amino acid N-acyltransferase YncA
VNLTLSLKASPNAPTTTLLRVRVRLVEPDDAAAMLAIYNPEVIETTVSFDLVPRTLSEQIDWIHEHRSTHPCIVAINDGDDRGEFGARGERVLGFASVSPFRERPAYATTVENSVYVHRDARGLGAGVLLLRGLINVADECGFHSLIARIVGENGASIALHERCGFTLVGTEIEVGRKHGRWLDVVEYQYVFATSP